MKISAATSDIY